MPPKNEHALARHRVTPFLKREARSGDLWYVKLGAWRWVVGLPDYVFCLRGHFGALELKHPDDPQSRTTARQRRVLACIERAGGSVLVCRDEQDVRDALADIRAGRLPLRRTYDPRQLDPPMPPPGVSLARAKSARSA